MITTLKNRLVRLVKAIEDSSKASAEMTIDGFEAKMNPNYAPLPQYMLGRGTWEDVLSKVLY